MKISDARLFAFDTETTGADIATARIVEVGGCRFVGGAQDGPPLNARINPGISIPPAASEVHGITDEDVAQAPPFANIAPRLIDAMSDVVPVGYNAARFDVPIINAEMGRHGVLYAIPAAAVVDPFLWMAWSHREAGCSLGDACAAYGVTLTDAHAAWADAQAAGRLVLKMVEAGAVPDDLDEARSAQVTMRAAIDEERRKWGPYLYQREDGVLRIGVGKHRGMPVEEVPIAYAAWAADRCTMPDDAAAVFRSIISAAA